MSASPPAAAGEPVASSDWMARPGLCSVTLRELPALDVLEVAGSAGLHCIEWGADVHAPPGDADRLRDLGERTRAAGLTVASYGSYWRAGLSSRRDIVDLAQGANSLGTRRIRVWAGGLGSASADKQTRTNVVRALRDACLIADDHGVALALEFHSDTLTDTVESTLDLLEEVGDPTLKTYWQPRLDEDNDSSVSGLRRLLPFLAAVHVFSWWPGDNRLALTDRWDLWTQVMDLLVTHQAPCDLLLEFVVQDDPERLGRDAQTLHELVQSQLVGGRV